MADIPQLITRIRTQMSRGQLVLFTGAGFSLGARNRRNEPMPSSSGLRDQLLTIAYPGEPPDQSTSLSDAFAVAVSRNRGAVQDLFHTGLSVAHASLPEYYRQYFVMPWHRAYTLNIDDLEMAVADKFDLPRQLLPISATTLATDIGRRPQGALLEVVHLNGMLSDSPDGWTFSEHQYAGRSASPDTWYARCAVDLRGRAVVFIGTELNESTLWQHVELRRRQGVEADINPPGSILVTPSLSRARADMLRAFNVEWIPMRADEFADQVLSQLGDAASKGIIFLSTYDESFGRAGIPLVSEVAAERPNLTTEFLMGEEPHWSDILQGRAAVRSHDAALKATALDILSGRREKTALGVTGTAGAGKSTALRRLALELSNEGIPVLWIDADSSADAALIRKRIAAFEDKVVLAIDDAELFGSYLVRLIRDAVPQRSNLLVAFAVPTSRMDEIALNLRRTGEVELAEHVVPNLTDEDIDGLIAVLDRHNRLGILKGADDEARRKAFTDKCGRQMIVAMIEATTGERFDQKIVKELLDLPPLQQFIYAMLCIAGRYKHFLTRDEVLLASQGLTPDPYEQLTLMVRRHIVSSPPPGTSYRPRHHVIADVVFEELRERKQLLKPLTSLVHALASKSDFTRLRRRDRVSRLLMRLTNHDFLLSFAAVTEAREVYVQVENLLEGDYHYWLQRGSLEVEAGELRKAELFLGQAKSLAPEDYKVDTEYGYLLLRKGIEGCGSPQAQGWIDEGTRLLEGVIAARGDTDSYPYHVLGSQGLGWARRARTPEERRRLLLYFENVVANGVKKHPFQRDLVQLLQSIKKDLLTTIVAPASTDRGGEVR